MKTHEWEPTDTQGYAMECTGCGKFISIDNGEEWDKSMHEECPHQD